MSSIWRRAFAAAAAAWVAALGLAPLAAHRENLGRIPLALADTVYQIGRVVCHQIPERSFQLMMMPLPVCARCTGIYAGAAAAAVLIPSFGATRHQPILAQARLVLVAAAIPTVATLVYEWTTGDVPAHWMRAAAGAPLGAAVAWIIREVN